MTNGFLLPDFKTRCDPAVSPVSSSVKPRRSSFYTSELGQINEKRNAEEGSSEDEAEEGSVDVHDITSSQVLPVDSTDTVTLSAQLKKSQPFGHLQHLPSLKLHRIYSENETSNFDSFNGRRMYDDDRHRPYRLGHLKSSADATATAASAFKLHHKASTKSFSIGNSSRSEVGTNIDHQYRYLNHENDDTKFRILHGMEDEYIPDFDFAHVVQQWNDSYYNNEYESSFDTSTNIDDSLPSSSAFSRPATPVGKLHSQVDPVSVPISKKPTEADGINEELIISKLPQNFSDLPFSVRRKLINDLSPLATTDVINKIVKRKFKKKFKSSPALQFLSSFSEKSARSNEGTIVLDHTMGKILGYGAWGIIRECADKDGNIKAMKIIRAKTESVKTFFKRETLIWAQLDHPNILPLFNTKESESSIFCLTKKASGGTLFDLVSRWGMFNSSNQIVSSDQRLKLSQKYALEIISALQYMHSKGFVHGDVKLENCLIDLVKPQPKILLCDFGMSLQFKKPIDLDDIMIGQDTPRKIKRRPSIPRSNSGSNIKKTKSLQRFVVDKNRVHDDTVMSLNGRSVSTSSSNTSDDGQILFISADDVSSKPLDDPNIPHSHIGSLPYAAPELLESSPPPLGPSADIWAFGVLLYTVVVGKLPFQHSFEPRLRAMISAAKYDTISLKSAINNDENFYNAITGCLTQDMNERLSLAEVSKLIEQSNV